MKKYEILLLIFIFFLSCIVHLFPLVQYQIWGSDTGEYYILTKRLVESAHLSTEYDGWGFGYPYFPGMFIITGSCSILTGLALFDALRYVIPILASLNAVFLFLIARKIFHTNSIAALSSIIMTVSMPSVFPTSHPMPGAIGDILFLMIFLVFLKTRENKKYYALAFLGIPAIALTHHLSAFLLFLSILCGMLLIHQYRKTQQHYLPYDLALLLWCYIWFIMLWVFAGGSFREKIVKVGVLGVNPEYLAIFGFPFFLLLYLLLKNKWMRKIFVYRGKFLDARKSIFRFLACIAATTGLFTAMLFIPVPGTSITLKPAILALFFPLMLIYSFALTGSKLADLFRDGIGTYGWVLGIAISLLVGIFVVPEVLIPYRHMEYLIVPLCIFSALGAVYIYRIVGNFKRNFGRAFLVFVAALCLLAIPSIYPDKSIMAGFQEGTSEIEFESVFWARENSGVYATDHRMSSMLFGFGYVSATWDTTPETFYGNNVSATLEELKHAKAPHIEREVNYVLITSDMKQGCAMSPLEPAVGIPPEVEEKFANPPFVKIYDNGAVQIYSTGL
ncbi:MAG: ArnT family glycosyltransferase [Thermoplasmata archaeon]